MLLLIIFGICSAAQATSLAVAQASFLCIEGNPLEICADVDSTMAVVNSNDARDLYSEYNSKGSVVFLNGNDTSYRWGGGANSFALYEGQWDDQFTPASHTKSEDGWTIETVYYAGVNNDVEITQTISYVNGNDYFQITWEVFNNGSEAYNDVRFMHGGDPDFQYSNDSKCVGHWDSNLKIIYTNDLHPQHSEIMEFFGSVESPASSYYEDYYINVRDQTLLGELPGTVNESEHDSGYALQWNRATLAPGDIWTITAFEKWTKEGYIQVIAPAEQTIVPNQTAYYDFIIHNYDIGDTFDLNFTSYPSGWYPSCQPTVYVGAGSSEIVTVEVTAPEGAEDGTSNTLTLTATSQNITPSIENSDSTTVVVDYSSVTYAVNFTTGTGGILTGETSQTVNYDGSCTAVKAVADAGYHFTGWSGNYTGTDNPLTITNVTSDIDITANFVIDTYTVTFTPGANGSITGSTSQTVEYGGDCTVVEAVADVNYHFTGWTGDYTGTDNPLTVTNVTSNMNITASFAINTYTVTFMAGINGSITGSTSQTVNHGENCTTVTAVEDTDYHFVGWSGDYNGVENPLTIDNVTSDMTITANFALNANTYTIIATTDTNGTISPSGSVSMDQGSSQTFTITPDTNYHVEDVIVDGTLVGAVSTYTFSDVTSDHTISATFAIDTYTLSFTAGTNGNITGSTSQTVEHGGNCTAVTAVADANYHFTGWTGDYTGTANPLTVTNVTSNMDITANFAINTYTVAFETGTIGGSLKGTITQLVNHGGSCTDVTAVEDTGYHFVGWSGDYNGVENPLTIDNVTSDMTITAHFAFNNNSYTIIATTGTNGTISPSGSVNMDQGSSQTFTIIADTNYHVADVIVDGNSIGAVTTYTFSNITSDHLIHATFAIDTDTPNYTEGIGGCFINTVK